MRTWRAFLGVIAVASAAVRVASADTPLNAWDAARDPEEGERYAVHFRARALMNSRQILASAIPRARALLEQAHAQSSPDVRLRFDLGELYANMGDNRLAIDVLKPALEMAPDHPAALSAYIALANAYAKIDDSTHERDVYLRYLPRITDDLHRATAMLNLAEADMHLGDLDASVAGYRSTIDLAASFPNILELAVHTGTLARWGLAVALDRSGDVASGAKEAKLAVTLDHDMLVIRLDQDVFFAPERERNWYVGLGYIEYAKEARDPRASAFLWHRAEDCWRQYLDDAKDRNEADRWVELAGTRLERAHAQRVAAERRVKGRLVYPERPCAS